MEALDDYIAAHISAEPEILQETFRYTHTHHLYPRMCSGHVQGRLLKMLTTMIRPRRVLELGAFTGYSTLCIAEGLEDGAVLDSIELDDELADELTERFEKAGYSDRIRLHIGDALEIVGGLEGEWDMVFMDADKKEYPAYYEEALRLLKRGGWILADNTLWSGHVVEEEYFRDRQTAAIRRFNDIVGADPRVEKVILPIRDGLTIIRKL